MTNLPSAPSRVGVLVPPANPTVEPEMHDLLSPRYVVHVARLPYLAGEGLADRLQAYREAAPDTLRTLERVSHLLLGVLPPDEVLYLVMEMLVGPTLAVVMSEGLLCSFQTKWINLFEKFFFKFKNFCIINFSC